MDLSEGDYGVSLLNDCKYGHDIQNNVIRITLLRSPTAPDPQADQGMHRFTYSLLPHPNDWRSGTPRAAYALNDPLILRCVDGGADKETGMLSSSLIAVDAGNVIIETVKQAQDGNGMIVRLYENERCRGLVTLRCAYPITAAFRCNILKENQQPLDVTDNTLQLEIKPYQIVTVRLLVRPTAIDKLMTAVRK